MWSFCQFNIRSEDLSEIWDLGQAEGKYQKH